MAHLKTLLTLTTITTTLTLTTPTTHADTPPLNPICPATAKSWDILLLIDQSLSLQYYDPNRERITAAQKYVTDLHQIAQFGQGTHIRVALATFGNQFTLHTPLTPLTQPNTTQQLHQTINTFGENDLNTDYILALYGTLHPNLDWTAECNRVIWLTDGEHDLDDAWTGDQTPKPYDAQQRRITNPTIAQQIETLLIPAICGPTEPNQITENYGNLTQQTQQLGIEIQDHLFHVGELRDGDTQTLLNLMNTGQCGRPLHHQPIQTWPPPPVCSGIPHPQLPTIWDGTLPEHITPTTLHQIIIQAAGNNPNLTTNWENHTLEGNNTIIRLTLNNPPTNPPPTITKTNTHSICAGVTTKTPTITTQTLTPTPIHTHTQPQLQIHLNNQPPHPQDHTHIQTHINNTPTNQPIQPDGTITLPPQPEGTHTITITHQTPHTNPTTHTTTITVTTPNACETLPKPHHTPQTNPTNPLNLPNLPPPAHIATITAQTIGNNPQITTNWEHHTQTNPKPDRTKLTLHFTDTPPGTTNTDPTITTHNSTHTCLTYTTRTPTITTQTLTPTPIHPTTQPQLKLHINGHPPTPHDKPHIQTHINNTPTNQPIQPDGTITLPTQPEGTHTITITLTAPNQPTQTHTTQLTITPKPKPPKPPTLHITEPTHTITTTQLTLPIQINDTNQPGTITLLNSTFPDGTTTWTSGQPKPQTIHHTLPHHTKNENQPTQIHYQTTPQQPNQPTQNHTTTIHITTDHPRNPNLENTLTATLLALLLTITWTTQHLLNRRNGRIKPAPNTRWATFTTNPDGTLTQPIEPAQHHQPHHNHKTLTAGPLTAKRKTPLNPHKPPHTQLTLKNNQKHLLILNGHPQTTGKHTKLHNPNQLQKPIILLNLNQPHTGIILTPTNPQNPVETQITEYLQNTLTQPHITNLLKPTPHPDT